MSVSFIDRGTYRMTKGGAFVRCQEHPELPAGTIVWSFGFAGMTNKWAVTGRTTNGAQEVVKLDENCRSDYFSDPFHTLDKYDLPISEQFGIGFYYDLDETPATDEEIAAAIERANEFIERTAREEAEEKEAARIAWEKATEEARAAYGSYLNDLSGERFPGAAEVAKNIRKVLAKTFPGQKFSVRKSSYDCIYIDWEDGPTSEEVQEATGMFEIPSERDRYNDDIYNYKESAFNTLFGGVKYLRWERSYKEGRIEALQAEIEAICPDLAEPGFYGDIFEHEGGKEVWEAYLRDAKKGHSYFSTWCNSYSVACAYLYDMSLYEAPAPKEGKAPRAAERSEAPAGLSIVDYSEKAIAVTGDTRPLADTLKALGGRFNARLSCGAGWVFSKKKEAEVREALAL